MDRTRGRTDDIVSSSRYKTGKTDEREKPERPLLYQERRYCPIYGFTSSAQRTEENHVGLGLPICINDGHVLKRLLRRPHLQRSNRLNNL